MGDQRSKATPKCTTNGSDCPQSGPYLLVLNRVRQLVRLAVDYIEDVTGKTNQMLQNSGKCCHVKGTRRASGGGYGVGSASSSWNDEKCGGWTLGYMSATSGGGEIAVCLSQSGETPPTGCSIKHFRGTFSVSHSHYGTTRLLSCRPKFNSDMAWSSLRLRIQSLANLRIM